MQDIDEKLVVNAKEGDDTAFGKLYSCVYKQMYYYAFTCLGANEQDACDVVSDAVFDAYRSIKKLRDAKKFKSWIFKILYNKIKKKQAEYIRSRQQETSLETAEELHGRDEEIYDKCDLDNALEKLDKDEREILLASVVGGFTSEEISDFTGTKSSTIRSKISRAKQKLKSMLE